jgi:hypothetical protein
MANGNGTAMVQHAAEGRAVDASIMERVIAAGDLSRLQPAERVSYYIAVCRSVGLNPLTKPFDYIQLNGKLTLYAVKNCTDQLRQIHGISVTGVRRETIDGVHVATADVQDGNGRRDEDIGAVSIAGLRGEALANALMKATTKAKRRATLSICGLSFIDESELETIPDARRVTVTEDGEIVDPPKRLAPKPTESKPAEPPPDLDAVAAGFEEQIGNVVREHGTKRDLKAIGVAIGKSPLDKPRRDKLAEVYDLALSAIDAAERNVEVAS